MPASDDRKETAFARYDAAAGLGPPRPTLLRALAAFEAEGRAPGTAVDLGCGVGRDALPLLRRGWRVLAVDRRRAALERLAERARAEGLGGLEPRAAAMEEVALPAADLVNASFSLFLCPPAAFPGLWARIRAALRPGGRFAGQLLGPRDGWARRPGLAVHDRAALDRLLDGLAVERLDEEESDAITPGGEPKRWHLWHVVARRPAM